LSNILHEKERKKTFSALRAVLPNDKVEARGCTGQNKEITCLSTLDNSDTVTGSYKGEKTSHYKKTSKRQQQDNTSSMFMYHLCMVLFRV